MMKEAEATEIIKKIRTIIDEQGQLVKGNNRNQDRNKMRDLENLLRKNNASLARAVIASENPQLLVTVAEGFGMLLKAQGVSSSQMRNIFGYVKRLEADTQGLAGENLSSKTILKLNLLSPKMAYIIGRAPHYSVVTLEGLKMFFDNCINEIGNSKEKFKRFVDTFEAILSYHKYYGGK